MPGSRPLFDVPRRAAYVEFLPENRPARSAVGVNGLALDARVEIECVAVVEAPV